MPLLNPSLDPYDHAEQFAMHQRHQIADFLTTETVDALAAHLRARADWRLVINAGDKVYEMDRAAQQSLTTEQKRGLDAAIHDAARAGFQFRYETIRVPDDPAERDASPLHRFAEFMSSPPVVALLREVTGYHDIAYADAQATCYTGGHFLTTHDDAVAGKNRRAAYVLSLTPEWRAEWGGLLLFHDDNGDVVRGFVPRFNVLNLLAVPQPHSVSMVTPTAAHPRYSITGWLRTR